MPVMEQSLGVTKTDLGLFLTLHGVLYGVSKFVNGFFGDRCHVRTFMVTGLVLSAVVNVFFGLSSAVAALGIFWMINGWFQGMGFPPCARAFTHWVPPKELATKMSIWNASTNIGAGAGGGDVQLPAQLLRQLAALLLCAGRAGLPLLSLPLVCVARHPAVGRPAGGQRHRRQDRRGRERRLESAWPSSMSSAIPTSGCSRWPTSSSIRFAMPCSIGARRCSRKPKISQLTHAGWMVAGFEISGMIGALIGGWLTDRLFGGRGFRSCVFYMAMAGVSVLLFWKVAGQSGLAQHPAPLRLGLLHLRPAMPHQHCRRQPRHQARRRHRRRLDRPLRLRQHDPFGLGLGQARSDLRLGRRLHRHAYRRGHRHRRLRARLEGQGARLRGLRPSKI